jgi:hypothetical protein
VVSATDPHDRNLGFLDLEPLIFHSSSSSIIFIDCKVTIKIQRRTFLEQLKGDLYERFSQLANRYVTGD